MTYLVKQLELAIRADMDVMAREYGLTALQYTALTVLKRHPGLVPRARNFSHGHLFLLRPEVKL